MDRNKIALLTFFLFAIFSSFSFGQQSRYFIYFKDKDNSPYSLSSPEQYLSPRALARRQKNNISPAFQDLPVNPAYVNAIQTTGAQVLVTSRWLNGALVLATSSQIADVMNLSCVSSYEKASRKGKIEMVQQASRLLQTSASIDYGASYNQAAIVGGDQMHAEGFAGKGLLIAVIDAGFANADQLPVFDSLFQNNRILATYDFVDNESDVFNDHEHGTQVLSVLAGYLSGNLVGMAWQADYLLLRSEDNASETLSEEYFWVRAAEYADSAGADMISSSLGYNLFDDPASSHTYADLNGSTAVITKATDFAAARGIFVVTGAGNEGDNPWKYLLVPADGKSVLTVGAVNDQGVHSSYSSIGPTADGRIKPDICVQGTNVVVASPLGGVVTNNGTSFAAPIAAGLAAGIWQKFPYLSNSELLYYLKRSSSHYTIPDYQCGYGIPNFDIASQLIRENQINHVSIMPNPVEHEHVVLALPDRFSGQALTIWVYDRMGRMISKEEVEKTELRNELKTDFSKLATGLYIMRITGLPQELVYKIVKI